MQLFRGTNHDLELFCPEKVRTAHKQAEHSEDTVHLLSLDLQKTLINMAFSLFGKGKETSNVMLILKCQVLFDA